MFRIVEQIEIEAPLETCYQAGIKFDKYPTFLKPLKHIHPKGNPSVWHWELMGPEGKTLECDTKVVHSKHNNKLISWESVRSGDIAHSGAITFKSLDGSNKTRVHLVIEYTPSGELYQSWNTQLEALAKRKAAESLESFKSFIESNFATVIH